MSDGTCLANSLGVVPARHPPSDFRYRSAEETTTLELDVGKAAMPGTEVPRDHVFRPGQRVLLLEDSDDFRAVLHDYLVSRSALRRDLVYLSADLLTSLVAHAAIFRLTAGRKRRSLAMVRAG